MLMKSLNPSILSLLLLTGCASFAPGRTAASADVPKPGAVAAVPAEKLPHVELTADLFYGVVASEIAAQRGASASSALTYYDLAQKTRDPRMAQRAAEFGLFSGQLALATDALSLWIEIDPDNIPAREQLLITQLRAGRLAQSKPLAEELLRRDPGQAPLIFVQLARLTAYQQDKAGAYQLVRSLAQGFPDLPEAHFAIIAVAAEVDDTAAVSSEFDQLARLAPKWDLPVVWQADRLRRQDLGAAIDFLGRELARRPDAGLELKMAYPRLLTAAKRFPEARQGFEALLKTHPDNPDLLYATGLLAFQLDDLPQARKRLEAALAAGHPESNFIRFSLGQLAEETQDINAAAGWYQQVTSGDRYLPAQSRLAFFDAQAGRLDAALQRLDGLGGNDKEQVDLALLASELARNARQYERSYLILTSALKRFPQAPELLYARALVSDLRLNVGDAERDLRAVIKQKPDDAEALNALGYTLANRTTRYAEAHVLLDRALKLDPQNPVILDSMGWVLFKEGRSDSALGFLQRAYKAMPDAEIAAHLGEVLLKLGRQQEARALLEQAAKTASGDHELLNDTMHRLLPQ
ncbi:tetratricopeptide repeat protein [Paludibacterium yongneupense]|uniref:tetratricopeptide repeat protein n=1 Tax=Paludibacterium yongneupense TaxID=400061 RepID=UPI0004090747|nr:tetratricopeptide repeat protein [Paludibacterium yongneupense]